MRWPFVTRGRHEDRIAVLEAQLAVANARAEQIVIEERYWRVRAERLMDTALARAGHPVVMVEPEPRSAAGLGPFAGMVISEIEGKPTN